MRHVVVVLLFVLLAPSAIAKGPVLEPEEGPDPRGLTVTGTGVSWGSKPAAVRRAVADARVRAVALARVAGLTLGDAVAVRERDARAELSYFYEPRRSPLVSATVAVTFATTQTAAAAPAGRAVVAAGVGSAAVRPRNRRSSASIRAALTRGRVAAAPAAWREARTDAEALAAATGQRLGAVVAITEVRRANDEYTYGSFGPGRYCGTVRQAIFRRDSSGRRRIVRRVTRRRCFFPREVEVSLRVTYLPA